MTPKTLTCVLVDDEQSNLDVLVTYVNQIPYLVLKATFDKPLEALAYLLKTPTDLLITDISMPRLSGIDLYEGLRSHVHTQVIFVSGYADKIVEALRFSVADYLHKPISTERFEQATQKALALVRDNQKTFDVIPTEILEIALENYSTLSEAERRILKLIYEGNTINEISEKAFISTRTVESHRLSIRKKLQLSPKYRLVDIVKHLTEVMK
jgi:DNA-binding NarL/FixJ family response regulator